ncbi:hypothetical protein Plo01_42980 [Planobispora longispora]|uniref:Uncharacterized protein n=1 Tax=Planobispora longispora TaxID=28887 RepID=A0A8J3W5V4_9ACTN|nr:hypothetical protein GCM10020093_051900 [Planobispora longispora]GIH77869.1 hypothetical protein Plo01_42980 [Planobispora longispora]
MLLSGIGVLRRSDMRRRKLHYMIYEVHKSRQAFTKVNICAWAVLAATGRRAAARPAAARTRGRPPQAGCP